MVQVADDGALALFGERVGGQGRSYLNSDRALVNVLALTAFARNVPG